mgnify:CR=1 FL=1
MDQRERCLNHVRYRSNICLSNVKLRGPLLSDAEANALDDDCRDENVILHRAGKRRHHVVSPSIRLQGPLLPIFLLEGHESNHHPLGRGHNYI